MGRNSFIIHDVLSDSSKSWGSLWQRRKGANLCLDYAMKLNLFVLIELNKFCCVRKKEIRGVTVFSRYFEWIVQLICLVLKC